MNVASFELCKELYGLSGWEPNEQHSTKKQGDGYVTTTRYDLGYLLRKLPKELPARSDLKGLSVMTPSICWSEFDKQWEACYSDAQDNDGLSYADTPEDAAAILCIELFKQGILK